MAQAALRCTARDPCCTCEVGHNTCLSDVCGLLLLLLLLSARCSRGRVPAQVQEGSDITRQGLKPARMVKEM